MAKDRGVPTDGGRVEGPWPTADPPCQTGAVELRSGRIALVTGASSGIGAAIARALNEAGCTVYAAARRLERMASLAEVGIHPIRADVTDDAAVVGLIDQVIAAAGRVDVLVNNAGYGSFGALEDVPLAEARRQFEVNVFGLARLTQLVLPHMRAQGSGYIVNISSVGGKFYEPFGSWYHATKFAVEGLSDSLRLEVAPFGIHVVVIEPGSTDTEWGAIAAGNLVEASARTAYAAQATTAARVLRSMTGNPRRTSAPDVVAQAVVRAVTSPRPRTRYPVGRGAKVILIARKLLPDRAYDRLIMVGFRFAGWATPVRREPQPPKGSTT